VPSRVNKVRGAAPARPRARSATPGARPAQEAPAASQPPVSAAASASLLAGRPQRAGTMSRRALKNWRVRSRLLLLIIIPTLTAVVLGGTYIATSVQNALVYQRVETLANLSSEVTGLAARLEDERDQTMEFIGQGSAGRQGMIQHAGPTSPAAQNLALVKQQQTLTAVWVFKVRTDSAALGAGYPAQVVQDAQNIRHLLQLLDPLRTAATTTQLPAVDVMASYTSIIDGLLSIDNNIAGDSGDPQLTSDVRSLNLVSLIGEEASEQRGLLAYAFAQDQNLGVTVLADVQTALAEQNANVAEYDRVATPQQVALYQNSVSGSQVDFASNYELQAITYGEAGQSLVTSPTTADEWYGAMSTGTMLAIRGVEQDLVKATVARARALHRSAIFTASLIGGSVLVVLLVALLLTTVVGRTMVRPLRRLRSGALEVAGVRLPETVRRMSESDSAAVPLEVEPIDVDSFDEIGEVARAFDQVHREALRLAANEAALRGNVNAMFVNLSRRSQSLVERQIRLIDDLEQGEQDPDRLGSLFQMDHLATRMRRNSENLLVLAGHEATRRWNQPVALVDVLRAAVSEIEQYERVRLNVQPGIAVRGHAVNDVVHLLAELAENATSFSSAETPVAVAGHLLSSGGVLLDITDQGVGMGAEEMAHANWRLDNPPVVDVAVSRRMGLFVVARLAARHGIRVRLRPAAAGGLTALVWLPDEVISHQSDVSPPGTRRFELPGAGAPAGAGPTAGLLIGQNGAGPAEQEINAARAPRFADLQADAGEPARDTGLGVRRIPGAGPHPGNVGWGGPASTSPLPAFGSPEAEANLAAAAAERTEASVGAPLEADAFAGALPLAGPDEAADEFTAVPTASPTTRPIPLGPPSVVGQQSLGVRPSPVGTFGGPSSTALDAGSGTGVVVPAAEHVTTENRLPIFEAVESDWFRRGRVGVPAGGGGRRESATLPGGSSPSLASVSAPWPTVPPATQPEITWRTSAADSGWEAAAAASSPSTGGTTEAGLPRRVPQANLVPGAAPPESVAPVPARSAAVTRDRFSSFQRGIREGRAAVSQDDEGSDDDDGSR
jgi:signal transduction histidine kinase/outer membrane murein-binding lipoprotein Lpp